MDCIDNEQSVVVLCDSVLVADKASSLKTILAKALSYKKNIIIQADNITQIDTIHLQLFLSFMQTLANLKIKCEWLYPSSSLLHSAKLVGLKDLLNLSDNE